MGYTLEAWMKRRWISDGEMIQDYSLGTPCLLLIFILGTIYRIELILLFLIFEASKCRDISVSKIVEVTYIERN